MSAWGHVPTFATPLCHVWKAAITRHSAPKVGYAPVSGPRTAKGCTSALCHKPTLAAFLDGMDSDGACGYSPFSGRKLWSVAPPQSWPPIWSASPPVFTLVRRLVGLVERGASRGIF